jgi:hypothetical protein
VDLTKTDWQLSETLREASGRETRPDPSLPRTGGPAGNARLTAWTGAVLLLLFAIEGVTLLDVRGLIGWHVTVGALLVPPALLKTAATTWRIARYYTGNEAYRSAGPPPLPLRILGPVVVLSTLAVLGTGILVATLGPESGRGGLAGTPVNPLFLHQASFTVWVAATTLHVLGRAVPAFHLLTGRTGHGRVAGRVTRLAALFVVALAAAWLGHLLLATLPAWQHEVQRHLDRNG